MSQPADQVHPEPQPAGHPTEPLRRGEILQRIVTTLPGTLQERDLEVGRLAIQAFAAGDELLAHELCELHSHPAHAWRRIRSDAAAAPDLTDEDRAATANAELQRQRFVAIAVNDRAEVERLSLALGLRPPAKLADPLPPPAPTPTTQHDPGVRVHYRRRLSWSRRAIARAFDWFADYTPLGGIAAAGAALIRGDTVAVAVANVSARRRAVSPADVFTKSK